MCHMAQHMGYIGQGSIRLTHMTYVTHDTYDPAQVTAFYIYAIGRTKLKAEQQVTLIVLGFAIGPG